MVYLTFDTVVASFSLAIIRNSEAFFNCLVSIEALSVVFF
jgi:hypothetical protein